MNQTRPPGALSPLKVAAYRRLWAASVASSIGTFMQLTVGPWLMLEMTRSPLMVSLVTTSLFLPRLLFTLPAGALADALDRRSLILFGQIMSALAVGAMAALQVAGLLGPWLLVALTFTLGVGNVINMPSMQTLIPDLVPKELFAQAITLQSAAGNLARALGPSIGGALAAAGLAHVAFGANAVSFLAVIAVALSYPRSRPPQSSSQHLVRSTALGWRYARFTPAIRSLLIVAALFFITTASVQALLPSVVSDILGLGATWYGILYGIFGVGAIIGALSRGWLAARIPVFFLPAVIGLFGLSGVVLGALPFAATAAVALLGTGAAWVWSITTINASIQKLAPKWVRGRVISIFLLMWGLQPFGSLASGVVAERAGVATAVIGFNIAVLILALGLLRVRLPVLDELEEASPVGRRRRVGSDHPAKVGGSPIVVTTSWRIDPDRFAEFMPVLAELRRQRLRTGATRWQAFRDAGDPSVVTEMFWLPDWDEHLAQHARLDAEAVAAIAHARSFDRDERPASRHLAGLDVSGRAALPLTDQLLTVHAELHRTDGSLPLADDGKADPTPAADSATPDDEQGPSRAAGNAQ